MEKYNKVNWKKFFKHPFTFWLFWTAFLLMTGICMIESFLGIFMVAVGIYMVWMLKVGIFDRSGYTMNELMYEMGLKGTIFDPNVEL